MTNLLGSLVIMKPVMPRLLMKCETGLTGKNAYVIFEITDFYLYVLLFYTSIAAFDHGNDALLTNTLFRHY